MGAGSITGHFDAVTCRDVLHDLVEDDERVAALEAFGAQCRPAACCSWTFARPRASLQRAGGRPRQVKVTLDERYRLTSRDGTIEAHEYVFTWRPWDPQGDRGAAGFADLQIRPSVGRRTADRLLVTATRSS